MKLGEIVKAKQLVTRNDGNSLSTNYVKRLVKGKVFYVNKYGVVWLDLGKYKESFYEEDIVGGK